jgi:small GTP-binding protein
MSVSTADFQLLPPEILYYIISFFDSNSIHNFVYVNKIWHTNDDVWKLLCAKKGIQDNEKRSSWRQLFTENRTTYVQVIEGWHCKTEPLSRLDGIPLQRVCMLGTGGVGLTAIIRQFLFKELFLKYDPTVEDMYFGQIIVNGERRNLELMDTAGQEEYSALRDQYIKCYKMFVYVYSITSVTTFQAIDKIMLQTTRAHENEKIFGILIGNKTDLKADRTVSKEEGEQKAKQWGIPYMETTIYDRNTILNAFATLLKNCSNSELPISHKNSNKHNKKNKSAKRKNNKLRKMKETKSCTIL